MYGTGGVALAPIPTINARFGKTGVVYKTTFKDVFKWKMNKKENKSKKGVKVKIINKKNHINIYIKAAKHTISIYKSGKVVMQKGKVK